MPHILVKLASGHSADEKVVLTRRLVAAISDSLGSADEEISIALEEVPAAEWMDQVYGPDIAAREAQLTKRPEYGPLVSVVSPVGHQSPLP